MQKQRLLKQYLMSSAPPMQMAVVRRRITTTPNVFKKNVHIVRPGMVGRIVHAVSVHNIQRGAQLEQQPVVIKHVSLGPV